MKNCFNGVILPFILTAFFILSFFGSCTSVDHMLGMGLLPDGDEAEFHQALLDGVNTHMAFSDSLPQSRLNLLYLGSYDTDGYGRIEANPVVQFVPGSFSDEDNLYGYKPHADSVLLDLTVNKIYGDPSLSQKFYIYKLTGELDAYTSYFSDFEPEAIADMAEPLFSFVMKDEKAGTISKKLNIEPAGEQYLKDLLDVDIETYKSGDSIFRQEFKGWYIAASKDPAEYPVTGGALYEMNPLAVFATYQFIDYSYFSVYAHSHKETPEAEDDTHIHDGISYATQDTVRVGYSFDDSNIQYPNTTILCVKHDYSSYPASPSNLVDISLFVDPETFEQDNPPHQDVIYIQGLMGVAGYLDFGGEFLSQLDRLCYNDKGEKCIMKVNRAKLLIWLEDDAPLYMTPAPYRLGMFEDYAGYTPQEVVDYSYLNELIYGVSTSYGGYLNRSLGYYEMDISIYVSKLANEPESTVKQVWLAPVDISSNINNKKYSPLAYSPSQIALQNKWGDPADPAYPQRIQLKLSYSLLKEDGGI